MKRLLLALLLFLSAATASALPLYTSREGRTCDNCHTLPNTWKNPELKDRKCSLSCSACHIDPGGGGLRNTAGRFFGQSTLPMLWATYRGYKDSNRFVVPGLRGLERPEEEAAVSERKAQIATAQDARQAKQQSADEAARLSREADALRAERQQLLQQALEQKTSAQQTSDPEALAAAEVAYTNAEAALAEATRLATESAQGAEAATREAEAAKRSYLEAWTQYKEAQRALQEAKGWVFTPAFGAPYGEPSANSPTQGRYGDLNADPLLSLGLDVRLASWSVTDTTLVFPMQLDTQVAIQPAQHLTAYVNAGVLAKEKGLAGTAAREHPYAIKDAMLIVGELPYNAYLKVGRFMPAFGTRVDDHTSFTRRDFELDYGIQESRVFGAEVGLAPNYPYASLSIFRPGEKDQFSADDPTATESADFLGVDGVGAALSAGYRELGWQLGGSLMTRRRGLEDGGNTTSASVQWGLNPWFYADKIPLTYLGEYALGRLQRASGESTLQAASYQELDYSVANGVTLRLKYDWSDPDFEVLNDHAHRVSLGADLTVMPGLRLSVMARKTIIPLVEEPTGNDVIFFVRGWL